MGGGEGKRTNGVKRTKLGVRVGRGGCLECSGGFISLAIDGGFRANLQAKGVIASRSLPLHTADGRPRPRVGFRGGEQDAARGLGLGGIRQDQHTVAGGLEVLHGQASAHHHGGAAAVGHRGLAGGDLCGGALKVMGSDGW